jgi:hypothetical protein
MFAALFYGWCPELHSYRWFLGQLVPLGQTPQGGLLLCEMGSTLEVAYGRLAEVNQARQERGEPPLQIAFQLGQEPQDHPRLPEPSLN